MQCPKCKGSDLASTTVRDVTVDRCPACAGIWFDERELPHILRLGATDLRPLKGGRADERRDEKTGDCPRDRSRMTRVHSASNPDIVVDTCLECRGIWLDGGELDAMTS